MRDQQPFRPEPEHLNSSYSGRSNGSTGLGRISSGNHLDDAGNYHFEDETHYARIRDQQDQDLNDGGELVTEKTKESNSDRTSADLEAGTISPSVSSSDEDEEHDTEEVLEVRDGIRDVRDRDMETPAQLAKRRSRRLDRKETIAKDPNMVTWDGPHDPENPKNWPFRRKWGATLIGIFTRCCLMRTGEATAG